jgi:DNA ligase-4
MARGKDKEIEMPDADAVEEEKMMYGHGALTEEELDEKYKHATMV